MVLEAEKFMNKYKNATAFGKIMRRSRGIRLANKLRTNGIILGSMKATELSPEVETNILAAAKIAFLVFEKESTELMEFESAVYYYRNYKPESSIVKEYDEFKQTNHIKD